VIWLTEKPSELVRGVVRTGASGVRTGAWGRAEWCVARAEWCVGSRRLVRGPDGLGSGGVARGFGHEAGYHSLVLTNRQPPRESVEHRLETSRTRYHRLGTRARF